MYCELCEQRRATEIHHKLSQTRVYKKAYPEFIHHPDNLVHICQVCHHYKSIPKWTEVEFCRHFNIRPRTKSGKQAWKKFTQ